MSYTKGKWEIDRQDGTITANGVQIANVLNQNRWYDGNLIAAAPEMYEVLRDIVDQMNNSVLDIDDARIEKRIREVLAKAEDKQ
jgi:hypothetical protein